MFCVNVLVKGVERESPSAHTQEKCWGKWHIILEACLEIVDKRHTVTSFCVLAKYSLCFAKSRDIQLIRATQEIM